MQKTKTIKVAQEIWKRLMAIRLQMESGSGKRITMNDVVTYLLETQEKTGNGKIPYNN